MEMPLVAAADIYILFQRLPARAKNGANTRFLVHVVVVIVQHYTLVYSPLYVTMYLWGSLSRALGKASPQNCTSRHNITCSMI